MSEEKNCPKCGFGLTPVGELGTMAIVVCASCTYTELERLRGLQWTVESKIEDGIYMTRFIQKGKVLFQFDQTSSEKIDAMLEALRKIAKEDGTPYATEAQAALDKWEKGRLVSEEKNPDKWTPEVKRAFSILARAVFEHTHQSYTTSLDQSQVQHLRTLVFTIPMELIAPLERERGK